ncbi:MAG: hypothetical protein WA771_06400 [Chthoniobacterales bacterium]
MRDAITIVILMVVIFACIVLQELWPPVQLFLGARVLLVPLVFCYGALTLPYPAMALLALFTGFLTDLSLLQVLGDSVEISVGWSILVYVAIGSICQGFRPLVQRGHWWIHAGMSAVSTSVLLALQFFTITLRRFEEGGIVYDEVVLWRILGPGIIALIVAPLFYFAAGFASGRVELPDRAVRGF